MGYGQVGNHGVNVQVKLVKYVEMDRDHVYVDVLVLLVSLVVEVIQLKKVFVVLVHVNGANGHKHQFVRQSNPVVVLDQQLILDHVMVDQVLVRVIHQRRKCANLKHVLVLVNGVSGHHAQLHAVMELNHDHELVMVNSILIVLVVLIIKLLVLKHHVQTVDGIITTVGTVTQVVIAGIREVVQLGTVGIAIVGILRTHSHNRLKLQLITILGLIYSVEIIICLAALTLETTFSNQIKETIYTKAVNKTTTLGNMFLAKHYYSCDTNNLMYINSNKLISI